MAKIGDKMPQEIKDLLKPKKEEITPRKIVGLTYKGYRYDYLVLSVGIGTITVAGLTQSYRFSKIPEINISRVGLDIFPNKDQVYVNFTNIRNLKTKDIEWVHGEIPQNIYNGIVNIIMLSFLGYSRVDIGDDGWEYYTFIKPRIKIDNPMLILINGMYNPEDEEEKEVIPDPKTKMPLMTEKSQEETEIKTTPIPSADILKELRDKGVYSTEDVDERIKLIFDTFDSYDIYYNGKLSVTHAYSVMFNGKELPPHGKKIRGGLTRDEFKLFVILDKFTLADKLDRKKETITSTKSKVMAIYNGDVNSPVYVGDKCFAIGEDIFKNRGITLRKKFIEVFEEEAKQYYETPFDLRKGAKSTFARLNKENAKPPKYLSFTEKKEEIILSSMFTSYNEFDRWFVEADKINDKNLIQYATGVIKWNNIGEDMLFDLMMTIFINKLSSKGGEDLFFILDPEYANFRTYILDLDIDEVIKTSFNIKEACFKIPIRGTFSRLKALCEFNAFSDEDKSKFVINKDDSEKLGKLMSINVYRSFQYGSSIPLTKKLADIVGIDYKVLGAAINDNTGKFIKQRDSVPRKKK